MFDDRNGYKELPDVTHGVFGRMYEKTDYRTRQAGPAYAAIISKRIFLRDL